MKKNVKLLLLIFISMLFVQNVSAKICKYEQIEGCYLGPNSTELKECKSGYREASAVFTLPSEKTAKSTPKISISYLYWTVFGNDKTRTASVDIKNWNETLNGAESAGTKYVMGNDGKGQCPEFILAGMGVHIYDSGDAYALDTDADVEKVRSNVLSGWTKESFVFKFKYIPTEEEIDEGVTYKSCRDFKSQTGTDGTDGCLTNTHFSCLWLEKNGVEYCNFDKNTYVKCGDSWDIPSNIPGIVSFLVTLLKIATPIILILVSIISLVKAVVSQKEDELKKAQSKLIKRLIAAAIVFFVVQITQFVIFKVSDDDSDSMSSCFSCMLNNDCNNNEYYKTREGNNYVCTYFDGSEEVCH